MKLVWKSLAILIFACLLFILIIAFLFGGVAPVPNLKEKAMTDTLKRVYQTGYGIESSKIEFENSKSTIRLTDVIANLPISSEGVSFACADEAFCGENGPLTVYEDRILVKQNAVGVVTSCVGCLDEACKTPTRYFVVVSGTQQKAEEEAVRLCNLG